MGSQTVLGVHSSQEKKNRVTNYFMTRAQREEQKKQEAKLSESERRAEEQARMSATQQFNMKLIGNLNPKTVSEDMNIRQGNTYGASLD